MFETLREADKWSSKQFWQPRTFKAPDVVEWLKENSERNVNLCLVVSLLPRHCCFPRHQGPLCESTEFSRQIAGNYHQRSHSSSATMRISYALWKLWSVTKYVNEKLVTIVGWIVSGAIEVELHRVNSCNNIKFLRSRKKEKLQNDFQWKFTPLKNVPLTIPRNQV